MLQTANTLAMREPPRRWATVKQLMGTEMTDQTPWQKAPIFPSQRSSMKQAVDRFADFGLKFGNRDFVLYAKAYGPSSHRIETIESFDVGLKRFAIHGAFEHKGCGNAVVTQCCDKCNGLPVCSTFWTSRSPCGARPYRRVIVVDTPVSSMNTSLLALQLPFGFEVRTPSDRLVSSAPE